jgi:MFS family permease
LVFAGALPTLLVEFQLQPDQVTLLGLTGYILLGLGAVPSGLATDRWGARRVLTVYFFGVAGAAGTVAMARTAWELAAALTGLGAALSLFHPAGLALITHGCRAQGRAMGINGVAGSIGVALGPVLGMYLALRGQWRLAYVLVAGLGLLAGLAMLLLRVDDSFRRHRRGSDAEGRAPQLRSSSSRGLWLLFAAMLLGGLNYRCLVTALPTFLTGTGPGPGSGHQGGQLFTLVILALGGVGQFVGGHTADRVQPLRFYAGLIAATVPLALLMAHAGGVVPVAAAAVLAMFMFGQQPVENVIMAQVTSPQRRSTMFGLKFMLTFGVGALGAQLVGLLWRWTGSLAPVFDVFAGSALFMAILATCFSLRQRTGEDPFSPLARRNDSGATSITKA